MMRLKKGDQVKIMKGKDRGKTGSILIALHEEGKVIVDGLNLFKKRARPKRAGQKGETVLVPRPLAVANVRLVCKNCKEAVRSGYRFDGEEKVRFCKKCQATT